MDVAAIVSLSPGEWVEFVFSEGERTLTGSPRVLAKISSRDGRWRIDRLIVDGDLDTAVLRGLPYGRMEATLNSWITMSPTDWKRDAREHSQPERFRAELRAIDKSCRVIFDVKHKPAVRDVDETPIGRPDGSDPDGFYRRVADRYAALSRKTKAPAKEIAEESGVPVTSVHRWIREARSRGFLPAARKGRAG